MSTTLNATHDPSLESWVESAQGETDFPIQNLPLGVFTSGDRRSVGIAIGESVLDLGAASDRGLLGLDAPDSRADAQVRGSLELACAAHDLGALMGLEPTHWRALRAWASHSLSRDSASSTRESLGGCLLPRDEVVMHLPTEIGDYTDFYASVFHATNVGSLFRPDNPLLPNYKWVPIGYHGRASTIVSSGTPVRRPLGQRKGPSEEAPSYGPCRALDYEMEVGVWLGGPANDLGETISIDDAEERIFGFCLLNDWSARDVQAWEYQPLGPFLGKSFASTVSPWVVTLEALAPFRCGEFERDSEDPQPLDYLRAASTEGGFDITVEVALASEEMRIQGKEAKLSSTSTKNLYWTPAQMVTHHASNGCVLRPGDLLGTGTVSGPGQGELGSLLEITRRGEDPLSLPDGETRGMLQDGDEVIFRGRCQVAGAQTIGFGECRGIVLPAAAKA